MPNNLRKQILKFIINNHHYSIDKADNAKITHKVNGNLPQANNESKNDGVIFLSPSPRSTINMPQENSSDQFNISYYAVTYMKLATVDTIYMLLWLDKKYDHNFQLETGQM